MRLNPTGAHRYEGACAALTAVTAEAKVQRGNDPDQARLRQRALKWLKADLAVWTKVVGTNAPLNPLAGRRFSLWKKSPELAVVREAARIVHLPEDERAAWKRAWAEVDAVHRKASLP